MKLPIIFIIGASLLTLQGCTKPDTVIAVKESINTCITPPSVPVVKMDSIKFKIIIDESGVWVGMTPVDYEKLSNNLQRVVENSKKKNTIIQYYKECVRD